MARVTIRVDTIDAGDVEVEESNPRRTHGQSDAEFIADLLDKAVAKIRAAYNLPGSRDVGRCTEMAPAFSDGQRNVCDLNFGHTGAHHDDATDADWWRDPDFEPPPSATASHGQPSSGSETS